MTMDRAAALDYAAKLLGRPVYDSQLYEHGLGWLVWHLGLNGRVYPVTFQVPR